MIVLEYLTSKCAVAMHILKSVIAYQISTFSFVLRILSTLYTYAKQALSAQERYAFENLQMHTKKM